MKKGVIITNAYWLSDKLARIVKKYTEEFSKLGVVVDLIKNDQSLAYIGSDGEVVTSLTGQNSNVQGKEGVGYDFVIYLDKEKHIARLLEKAGLRLFNSSKSIEVCDDKMCTNIALANEGVKMPLTISSPLMLTDYRGEDIFLKHVKERLKTPLIVKENYGSFGRQVYLIKNERQLNKIRKKLKRIPHLYQEYIEESHGRDMRVIVIGGKMIAAMERVSRGDFRSNIDLGGKGKQIEVPKAYEEMAIRCAEILGLDYCGVDILFGKDGPVVCEVNSNAFFDTLQSVTGVNIAEHYAKYIYGIIYGEIS